MHVYLTLAPAYVHIRTYLHMHDDGPDDDDVLALVHCVDQRRKCVCGKGRMQFVAHSHYILRTSKSHGYLPTMIYGNGPLESVAHSPYIPVTTTIVHRRQAVLSMDRSTNNYDAIHTQLPQVCGS